MKINIDQKKFIAVAPLIVTAVILSSFFAWQFKMGITLKEDLASKKKEFKRAENASMHLRDLEKQISDIKQKEEMLYKRVPVNEKEPLGLIRSLIRLGGQAGLKGITVSLKEKALLAQRGALQSIQGASQGSEVAPDEASADQSATPAETPAEDASVAPQSGPAPVPVYIQMEFEGSFPQLLSFLDKLMNLERIVKIEGMSVQRKKDIIPYQKVSLDLVTYTF